MTSAGLAKIQTRMDEPFVIPADILRLLKKDAMTWKNFQAFPDWYWRIRIGWIEATRQQGRLDVFERRLAYFLKMTAQNRRFGMVKWGSSVLTRTSFRIPDSESHILGEGARRIFEQ